MNDVTKLFASAVARGCVFALSKARGATFECQSLADTKVTPFLKGMFSSEITFEITCLKRQASNLTAY